MITIAILILSVRIPNSLLIHARINKWIIQLCLVFSVSALQKGIVSKICKFKIINYLGEISMYFFMIHQPILKMVFRATGKTVHYRYEALFILLLIIMMGVLLDRIKRKSATKVVHNK